VDGEPVNYWKANVGYTNLFNLAGNPVVAMPIGFNGSGLPIGVQVVGSRWRDARLLTVAGQLFDAAGVFRTPPGYGKGPRIK
jgi:amidase